MYVFLSRKANLLLDEVKKLKFDRLTERPSKPKGESKTQIILPRGSEMGKRKCNVYLT
jgi:hypothetical protein